TANEIAAGTIAARNMAANSINASHIVGSSITADKLNVNNLAAISANLGAITAGSININNRFKVSNAGVVEMRANSGNVGMVMNNNSIIVYDEQGRVRVKMGKL
ncbi:phage tail protein, partial [Mannheimia haemolytica]